MNYYLILSQGCYSDYSPRYFVGSVEVTQEEYDKKGREVGDMVIKKFQELPERKHVCEVSWCGYCIGGKPRMEKYDPTTNKMVYIPSYDEWQTVMIEWLTSLGFTELPDNIPEINIDYSDLPHNK